MRARRSGFTLIELCLVLLIVAIVMAVVAPSLRNFLYGRQADNAVTRLLALTRHARSQAITHGRVYRLNVDESTGGFWVDTQQGAEFKQLGTEFGQHYALPEGTKAAWNLPEGAEARDYVRFYPDGRCEGGTLTVTGSGGEKTELGPQSESEPWRVLTQ